VLLHDALDPVDDGCVTMGVKRCSASLPAGADLTDAGLEAEEEEEEPATVAGAGVAGVEPDDAAAAAAAAVAEAAGRAAGMDPLETEASAGEGGVGAGTGFAITESSAAILDATAGLPGLGTVAGRAGREPPDAGSADAAASF